MVESFAVFDIRLVKMLDIDCSLVQRCYTTELGLLQGYKAS